MRAVNTKVYYSVIHRIVYLPRIYSITEHATYAAAWGHGTGTTRCRKLRGVRAKLVARGGS